MTTSNHAPAAPRGRQVLIERIIRAPRAIVFEAWANPDHLARWYAPHGCTIEIRTYDFREGGAFQTCIHTPDGKGCWCHGAFREIVDTERIVFSMEVCDAGGNPRTAIEAGMHPDWPDETVVTVTFEALGETTRLTLHQTVSEALAKETGAHPSWLQMLDQLDALLNKDPNAG